MTASADATLVDPEAAAAQRGLLAQPGRHHDGLRRRRPR